MSINSQPSGVRAVYTPLIFNLTASIPISGTETLKNVIITVKNLETLEEFTFRQNFDSVIVSAPNVIGSALVDVSAVCQSYFCTDFKPVAFGALGVSYNVANITAFFDVEVTFKYEKINTSGFLEDIGVTDVSSSFTVLNSTRSLCDDQSLDEYVLPATDRKFLTNRPECVLICLEDSDFLQYWSTNITMFEVKTFDADGVLIDRDTFNESGTINNDELASVGSGPANINAVTTWNGLGLTIDSDVHFYTVQAGRFDIGLGAFVGITALQKFALVECCDDISCRLFWLNRLGGVDAYTFRSRKRFEDSPSSQRFEKSLFNNPATEEQRKSDFGLQKYDSRDRDVLVLTSEALDQDTSDWLRELQTSTRVYKATAQDELISVVVRDQRTVISDRDASQIVKEITIDFSIDSFIQNNI